MQKNFPGIAGGREYQSVSYGVKNMENGTRREKKCAKRVSKCNLGVKI
jgi:hypothetical protein